MTERLWDIPPTWEWSVIRELGNVVSGGTPSTKVPEYWGGDVIWFAPSDLTGYKQKFIARGAKTLSQEGLIKSSAKLMPAGSVMFSSRAPVGYVAINSQPSATNQGFKSIVPHGELFNEYLYHYLHAAKHIAEERATGTTFKELSGSAFSALPVPVAPANEQRRIVGKIEALFDEIDRGVENLRAAKSTLDLYRKSLLKSAFEGRLTADWRARNSDKLESTDALVARIGKEREQSHRAALDAWKQAVVDWREQGENGTKPAKPKRLPSLADVTEHRKGATTPREWTWLPLAGLGTVTGGLTKNQRRNSLPQKTKYLRVANVYTNRLELDEIKEIGITPDELRRTRLLPGDLLFVEGNGSVDQIGRVALWDGSIAEMAHQNHLIRFSAGGLLRPRFALLFCMSPVGRKLITAQASSTSGLYTLSISKVQALPLPVCVPAEQDEVVHLVGLGLDAADVLETEIDQSIARATLLRQSILKTAFAGQLVPQDPSDEPAATLLQKIAAEKSSHSPERTKRKVSIA